jgi:DNA primase
VAAEFFQNQLQQPAGQMALKYLMEKRKLTVATLTEFKLGYAPNDWRATSNFLKARGFNDYEIKQSGMVVDKENSMPPYYDRFRHRLTFPILDHHGNIVGFTARALDENESAKYINTPQTLIYNKSQIVFGLDKAKNAIKEKDLAILVEGNMDVIASYQAGVKNVVAVSGTSLTFDQIKLIKRYSRNVALCFDTDAAGVAAGLRGIEMLWQEEMNIKIVILPTGYKDPDELVQKDVNQWQQATEQAEDLMEYLFAKNLQGNLKDLNAKRRAAKVLLPWMARLKDEIAQNHYLKLLAESIEISEDVLRQGIRQIRDKGQKGPVAPRQTEEQKEAAKFSRRELVAERFLALLLFYPLFLGRAAQILGEEHFSGLNQAREFYRELVLYYTKGEGTDKEILRENLRQRTAGKKELEDFFNTLELLAETEFETWSERELAHEFENGLEFLRRCFNDGKRMELQAKIKAAEKAGDMNLANQLLGEFAKIN